MDAGAEGHSRSLTRAGILAGIVAPILAWGLSVAVIASWPGYDPVGQSISILATAPLGWLQSLAFAVSGVLGVAWALALATVLGARPRDRLMVRVLLLIQALVALGFALLPTDPEGAPVSVTGSLHLLDFGAYAITMPLTLLALGLVMRRDPRWCAAVRPTLAAGAVVLFGIPLVPATISGPLSPWLGALERVFVAVPSIWQVGAAVVAWRLASNSTPGSDRPARSSAD